MKRRGLLLAVLAWMLLLTSYSFAGVGSQEITGSQIGTELGTTIFGQEVQLNYTSEGGSNRSATDNVSDVTVEGIYGYNPQWEAIPTRAIEPGDSEDFEYQIANVGNTSDTFIVSYNVISYTSCVAGDWEMYITTTSITLPYSGQMASPLTFTVTGSLTIDPHAVVVATVNIRSSEDPTAMYYTGDNGFTYAGFGEDERTVTISVQVARLSVTKNYSVQAPAGYVSGGGSSSAAIPGALITYTIEWENIGSIAADNVSMTDWLPTPTTTLTGNVATANYSATTVSYYWNSVYNATASENTEILKVEYESIPAGTTGNFSYQLIIK